MRTPWQSYCAHNTDDKALVMFRQTLPSWTPGPVIMPPSGDLVHKIKLHQEEQQEARKDVVVRFKERLSDIEELPAERELLRWIEATNVSIMRAEQEMIDLTVLCREISRYQSPC